VTVLFWHWDPAGHVVHREPERYFPDEHTHFVRALDPRAEVVDWSGQGVGAVEEERQ
jgi:hypothetical protein